MARFRNQKQVEEIFDSFKYLLRQDLLNVDSRIRSMYREAKAFSVTDDKIDEVIIPQLMQLCEEVIKEGEQQWNKDVGWMMTEARSRKKVHDNTLKRMQTG